MAAAALRSVHIGAGEYRLIVGAAAMRSEQTLAPTDHPMVTTLRYEKRN
ncbi:hypothetical protein GCM10025790_21480 [Nesterenkonia rhizosphaerae]|uniref:Uncharacterized protein n=1 Tax=Nesterenkonia rhizosphaerae TaxID=1348272 RepID=A0ABP9G366_9MICC